MAYTIAQIDMTGAVTADTRMCVDLYAFSCSVSEGLAARLTNRSMVSDALVVHSADADGRAPWRVTHGYEFCCTAGQGRAQGRRCLVR